MRRSVAIVLSCIAVSAAAAEYPVDAFPLRSHNPFLQIYGLPPFATHELVAPGGVEINVSLDIANDMDEANRGGEVLLIDGESRVLNLSLRRRVGANVEVGLEIPYISYSGGFLDSLIYDFHDLVSLSNSTRDGPEDLFRMYFEKDGVTQFDLMQTASGIGDVQLTAAMQLERVTLRAGLKAPTGDPDKLTGSGAADASFAVHGGGRTAFLQRNLDYSGFAGILALGDGDVLPTLQRSVVPYAGVALRWHATERFALATQVYAQGSYSKAYLDELGGNTFQLAFGFDYRFPRQGLLLRIAIAEDIAAAAAPDFAAHLSIRRYGR